MAQPEMVGLDAADPLLDAGAGRLYPLVPGISGAFVLSFELNGLHDKG